MRVNRPKRHHYVPQFLQSHFVDQGGRLHVYRKDRPELGVHVGTPKDVFVERHLYSTVGETGERNPAQELEYAKLDGAASSVIRKIITAARQSALPNLDAAERETWIAFLYH